MWNHTYTQTRNNCTYKNDVPHKEVIVAVLMYVYYIAPFCIWFLSDLFTRAFKFTLRVDVIVHIVPYGSICGKGIQEDTPFIFTCSVLSPLIYERKAEDAWVNSFKKKNNMFYTEKISSSANSIAGKY